MNICIFPNCAYLSETSRMIEVYKALIKLGKKPIMATHGGLYEFVLKEEQIPYIIVNPVMSTERCIEYVASNRGDRGLKGFQFYSVQELRDIVSSEIHFLKKNNIKIVLTGFTLSLAISTRTVKIPLAVTHLGSWVPIILEEKILSIARFIPVSWKIVILNALIKRTKFIAAHLFKPFNIIAKENNIEPFVGMLDIMLGDYTLITDVPELLGISKIKVEKWTPEIYELYSRKHNFKYVGALYAKLFGEIPDDVKSFLDTNKQKIYVALTSSKIDYLKSVYSVLKEMDAKVIFCSTIHRINETKSDNILVKSHLPSHNIMPLCDLAIIHGGQGSVQTAIAGGTPIIGFPLQPEQRFNLKQIEKHEAGICLSTKKLKTSKLKVYINSVLKNNKYKKNMMKLKSYQDKYNGPMEAAKVLCEIMQMENPTMNNTWSNIEVSSNDQEILAIDRMEHALGNIPKRVYKVRELITRFESCHFKYQRHYQYIIKSIAALHSIINIDMIGSHHPCYGKKAIDKDTTGRSQVGQQYISALNFWLNNTSTTSYDSQKKMNKRIALWLDEKNDAKEKLVTMLLDRLLNRSLEKYFQDGIPKGLEYQIMATDICNYAFPQNIDQVIQAIGKLEPVKNFHGCGTTNSEIKSFISREFKRLCLWLTDDMSSINLKLGEKEPMKIWLVACLAKTMKEQIHLVYPLPELVP